MNDQKAENLLNLALDATEEEREKSQALNIGYNREERKWELIVKYNGNLDVVSEQLPEIEVSKLSGGYAVMVVPESLIEPLAGFSQIEFIEKPKRLYFSINKGKSVSCINALQPSFGSRGSGGGSGSGVPSSLANLTGRGVILAVIDSGIDYFHDDFRNEDGTTRILELWDQDRNEVYTSAQINEALTAGSREEAYRIVPSRDLSGHGTAVAGIAGGNGRADRGRYRGVAFESPFLVVKLGAPRQDSFPRTTQLMRALDFVHQKALEYEMPLAVNLSFGNTYGSHEGNSLLETYIDTIAASGRNVVVAGTGNEGSRMGHTAGQYTAGRLAEVELAVAEYEPGFGVQLWKIYSDEVELSLVSPSGISIGPVSSRLGSQRLRFPDTTVLLYYGEPSPYSKAQEIYMDFIPGGNFVESGNWKIQMMPRVVEAGQYDLWLPSGTVLNRSTRFLFPVPDTTLTIPSTSARALSVGAYDDTYLSYADFSGRGFTRLNRQIKPDLVAPGVAVIAPKSGGGYEAVTGTSFAAPFVTGSAALMMQWGITDGNDPFLYGEKVKAYLIKGAKRLPGEETYPNPRLGWGTLCLERSFP